MCPTRFRCRSVPQPLYPDLLALHAWIYSTGQQADKHCYPPRGPGLTHQRPLSPLPSPFVLAGSSTCTSPGKPKDSHPAQPGGGSRGQPQINKRGHCYSGPATSPVCRSNDGSPQPPRPVASLRGLRSMPSDFRPRPAPGKDRNLDLILRHPRLALSMPHTLPARQRLESPRAQAGYSSAVAR